MTHTPAAVLDEVERRLDRYFDAAFERATRHSPHYHELWRELRVAAAGGKRLRPRLVVTTALLLGGPARPALVDLATAIELLHTALLLHDDVIDGDLQRRGAPNLVGAFAAAARRAGLDDEGARHWGDSAAILAGDLLLTASVRLTAGLDLNRARRDELVELIDESIFRAAAGELADVAYAAGLGEPTPDDIRAMMADKTAHYSLELPLRAGAILAGAPRALADGLGAIGQSLGIVFQMRDDLLGVFGESAETGKSTSNDLREGKQTLLIAFARGTAQWDRVADRFGRDDLDEADAQALRDALEACGARERLERAVRDERDEVRRLVDAAGLPDDLARLLAAEVELAAERRA